MKRRRTKVEVLEHLILECLERFEKLSFCDFEGEDLDDLNWNATNLSGSIANMVELRDNDKNAKANTEGTE